MRILFEINLKYEVKTNLKSLDDAFKYAKQKAKENNCNVKFWNITQNQGIIISPNDEKL